jgi:CHAT domain-containing protein
MAGGRYGWLRVVVFTLLLAGAGLAQGPPAAGNGVEEFAQTLLKAKTDEERRELLAAKKELVTPDLYRAVFSEGNVALAGGRYAPAGVAYALALQLAEQLGDKKGAASALLNAGTVEYLQGDYDSALESYGKARAAFQQLQESAEAARALMGVGFVRKEQGKSAEALDALKEALAQLDALKPAGEQGQISPVIKGEMTDLLNTMGSIYYDLGDYNASAKAFQRSLQLREDAGNMQSVANAFYFQGNYSSALEYYQKALAEFEKQKNDGSISSALGGLANSYYSLGDYDRAAEYYLKNLPLLESLKDKAGVAATREDLGNLYRAQGDLGSALESYRLSLKAAAESGGKINTASVLGGIGIALSLQGDNVQALDYYQQSLTQFRAAGDRVGMARMLVNIGNTNFLQGSYPQALDFFQQALALREAMGDRTGVANILLGMGSTYAAQGSYAQALQAHQKALALFEAAGEKEGMASALRRLGAAYALQGDYAQALSSAERAVSLAAQAESLDTLWRAQLEVGKYNQAQNRAAPAQKAFEESIKTLELLRARPLIGEPDFTPAGSNTSPYAEMSGSLAEQDRAAEAFAFAERAKTYALRTLLQRDELKINGTLTPQEQEQERGVVGELVSIQTQLGRARQRRQRDEALLAGLNNRLRQAQSNFQSLRARLYAAHPQLGVYRGGLPAPSNLAEAASLLPDAKTAFVEYVVTENKIYMFVLTRGQASTATPQRADAAASAPSRESAPTLKAYVLGASVKDVTDRVVRFRQTIARPDADASPLARELYDLLLKPAQEQIDDKTALVISPDALLWALPFQALRSADNQYLIERSAVSYAPSLSAWREMARAREGARRGAQPVAPTLAAFANPVPREEVLARVRLTNGDEKFEPSPLAEREVQGLKQIYGPAQSRVYVGAEASEERLKAAAGGAAVLHLAAYADINEVNPMYSFVMLSGGDPSSRNDGLLNAWEVAQLQSKASLVVLSASSTARGQWESGGGEVGLTWSWFVAGIPATLASQWRVASPATAELMVAFHRQLRRKPQTTNAQTGGAEALRQAVLSLLSRAEYRAPFYWAGFRLYGDVR